MKGKPLDVKILSYDDYIDMYVVEYTLFIRAGVSRRSKAFYRGGELSRDNDNDILLEKVREGIKGFNKVNKIKV